MTAKSFSFDRQIFTLHMWQETIGADESEWRGQVKHIPSGRVRYFRNAHSLYDALMTLICEEQATSGDESG